MKLCIPVTAIWSSIIVSALAYENVSENIKAHLRVKRVESKTKDQVNNPKVGASVDDAAANDVSNAAIKPLSQNNRKLCSTMPKWHAVYAAGWPKGHCQFTIDCNTPPFETQLACCMGAYIGQVSGYCLGQLPSPPTISPSESGGLNEYYADWSKSWDQGTCINTRPRPSGSPVYPSMLLCCKKAYASQMSGACLAALPSPSTISLTSSDPIADFYYPRYGTAWPESGCSNKLPLPFNPGDIRTYATHLECCESVYGDQMSGQCLSEIKSSPTMALQESRRADFWYPDYSTPFAAAKCLNALPLPYAHGARITYPTYEACCSGVYGGQSSLVCVCGGENPPDGCPTEAPTSKPTQSPSSKPSDAPSSRPSSSSPPSEAPSTSIQPSMSSAPSYCTGEDVIIEIKTDKYPEDISWELVNNCGTSSNITRSYSDADAEHGSHSHIHCLPLASYTFVVSDTAGDGFHGEDGCGWYTVSYRGRVVKYGRAFNSTESTTFGSCQPSTLAPTQSPTPRPTCPNGGASIKIDVVTDSASHETSWTLKNDCDASILPISRPPLNGPGFTKSTLNSYSDCVPPGTYTFELEDSYGDGICCTYGCGFYEVTYEGTLVAYGDEFGYNDTTTFGGPC